MRPARAPDADRVTAIARSAFSRYVQRIGRPPAPMRSDYAGAIARGAVWVAERDGHILGLLMLAGAADHLVVDSVAVDPDHHGTGVGRSLLRFAEDEARRRRLPAVELCTNEAMTENLDMYARIGYRELRRGEQDGYRRVFLRKQV